MGGDLRPPHARLLDRVHEGVANVLEKVGQGLAGCWQLAVGQVGRVRLAEQSLEPGQHALEVLAAGVRVVGRPSGVDGIVLVMPVQRRHEVKRLAL